LSIGSGLNNIYNQLLTTITGLNNLISVGGNLRISGNDNLTSIVGLNNLVSVEDNVLIGWYEGANPNLISLEGLNSLEYVGGFLQIDRNYILTSLSGLESISEVSGDLRIGTDYGTTLEETGNPMLVDISALSNLVSLGGGIEMSANELLPNLNGLENLSTVAHIYLYQNNSLSNLSGLDNIITIDGGLQIEGLPLTNLSGLINLTSIGDFVWFIDNDWLTDFSELHNLTSINGELIFSECDSLLSLSGLDSLDAGSIENLSIFGNPFLSSCEVQSICDYLAAPGGVVNIYDNAPGCNSQEEVVEACDNLSISHNTIDQPMFTIFPNPCLAFLNIEYIISESGNVQLDLYEISGVSLIQLLNEQKTPGTYFMELDVRDVKPGIYFCTLKTNAGIQTRKIIKLE